MRKIVETRKMLVTWKGTQKRLKASKILEFRKRPEA